MDDGFRREKPMKVSDDLEIYEFATGVVPSQINGQWVIYGWVKYFWALGTELNHKLRLRLVWEDTGNRRDDTIFEGSKNATGIRFEFLEPATVRFWVRGPGEYGRGELWGNHADEDHELFKFRFGRPPQNSEKGH